MFICILPIVSFLIFYLEKTLKFSLKSLIFLDILMTTDMLSTFLCWTIFVKIAFLTKSTFDWDITVCNILWGESLLIASAKSFMLNGFSVDQTSFSVKLLLWPKSLRLKSKSFIFFGSIVFWFWQPHIGIACIDRIGQTDSNYLQLQQNISKLWHGYMFLPYQPYTCN